MAWKQKVKFNQSKGGSKHLYCLQNVRLGFGIPAKYPNAITAWENTEQHKNKSIPKGVDVPLYYGYGVEGHINVRLANGKIWNDGKIFSSLSAFEKAWSNVDYKGWGESINDVKVIGETMEKYKGHSIKHWYTEYQRSHKNSLARKAEIDRLKAQLGDSSDANLLGKALLPVLAKLGYKKK